LCPSLQLQFCIIPVQSFLILRIKCDDFSDQY
jgi:hypothetical protein